MGGRCRGAVFLQHAGLQLHQSGVRHGSDHPSGRPTDARFIFSGYLSNYAYDLAATDASVSFEKLRELSKIDDKAARPDADPNFSARIREGVRIPR